jgi:hypothetical protein
VKVAKKVAEGSKVTFGNKSVILSTAVHNAYLFISVAPRTGGACSRFYLFL